ncbi:acylphosphatase [bacterium]|nr:acylphosphatase [bacterium]
MTKKHFELYIKGRVQGVWYRKSCAEKATALGIYGLVKNMPDGSVYCEAEGQIDALIDFIDWCGQGPELARVESVLKVEGQVKNYTTFEIIR